MITSIKNAEHYTWGNNCEGWNLLKSATLVVKQEKMPSGTSEILHFHNLSQQVFYILCGIATFEIDGRMIDVNSMESIHIQRGVRHRIINNTAKDLEFLLISEPPSEKDRTEL